MKQLWIVALLGLFSFSSQAQEKQAPLYDTAADAKSDIKRAVALAAKEHKNVMLQVGGNWCIWCTRFHNTVAGNDTLNRLMNDNYVV
ncbi:MAG: thioredoxin family protein, partial [Sphingobacteriales bacterium]